MSWTWPFWAAPVARAGQPADGVLPRQLAGGHRTAAGKREAAGADPAAAQEHLRHRPELCGARGGIQPHAGPLGRPAQAAGDLFQAAHHRHRTGRRHRT
ncbi:hypothetical protein G6F40_016756 [Rhizopus arrhizus]|nr:hypothetical protein G6F40_016756 [Rhizopus arrhizus]